MSNIQPIQPVKKLNSGFDRETLTEEPMSDIEKPQKKKRRPTSKTFHGCDSCRSRRIRCDLAKPGCKNCEKVKMECPGYGITLWWLSSPKFTKSGDIINSLIAFKSSNRIMDENASSANPTRRRLLEFVKWEKGTNSEPYETYEDLDRDLMILDNSEMDEMVGRLGKTKSLGPFGVFSNHNRAYHNGRVNKPLASRKRMAKNQRGQYRDKIVSGSKVVTPSSLYPTPLLQPNEGEEIGNEQLWLSNELRDDALLTAAALGGDTHLLDFMNNFTQLTQHNNYTSPHANQHVQAQSPANNHELQHMHQQPVHQVAQHLQHQQAQNRQNQSNVISNPNEFLNLLFHKNQYNTQQATNFSPVSIAATPNNGNNLNSDPLSLNNLVPPESNILIDPTNQHLYYSNYNNYFYDNPYKQNKNLEIYLHASSNNPHHKIDDDIDGDGDSHNTKMPSTIMNVVQSPLQPTLGFHLLTPNSLSVGLPTTALQIQPLTRYLLNYYVTNVADLMTVLPLTESPWKTIYFPRALMAIGELSALGKTSTAKNALLNALLAVSAFNLQSKFPKNSDTMKFYLNLGIRLRNQASLFIKKLLGSSNDTQLEIEKCLKNEKYKDVLCAVMSMISVDLVWGTMQDTGFYIKWCGKVIATKMQNKKKLSPKARILHRIFLSLKIIQDSTCLSLEDIRSDYKSIDENGYDINGENFIKQNIETKKSNINYIVNENENKDDEESNNQTNNNTTPLFINKKLINTKNHNENFATDALYGLPNSLIKLFSRTVQLIRRKIYNEKHLNQVPKNFDIDVEDLNNELINWTLDWKLFVIVNDEKNFYSPMHEVTYHHIMSFYYGLTIYFKRLVKQENPTDLQDKVKLTLSHLNSIQKLIVKENVGIIPLFWQGFIAGCEATSSELQMGYKKWGADISQYLGSYWGARQIMLEVWRRKRLSLSKDDWVGVINDWEMNLMLN